MKKSKILSPIKDIIEDARNGKMYILVDDEERENEGDLVIPAQMATPEAINFMAKYGRGLICLSLTPERIRELELPLMASRNNSRHQTAFTVSIEAREGVTTGISASDRARTISVAINPTKTNVDIASPGHIFPLVSSQGGVIVRAGHTEAAVDVSRLAGLNPSGVICEIMNDDGSMARLPELIKFAQSHSLKIGTIADLIAYRLMYDRLVECKVQSTFNSNHGGKFKMFVYVNKVVYAEHIVLTKGEVGNGKPVMVRMHALNLLEDVLSDATGKCDELHKAMNMVANEGRGIIVLIREPLPTSLSDRVREKMGEEISSNAELRDYGVGAQILLDLGVKDMILLSNTHRNIVGLEGYGLSVVEQRSISG
ncbi:MAG: 3,4-dihydroxy-2-butanone-4-phosphate synthase [Magnetovibrio sp.]|nr:3,4-dihydroxy-2-butanone-4-phosphate synthase [Magnetovibrio sp.]